MYGLASLALVAASLVSSVSAQACTQSGGNWYCNQVNAVSYLNFGTSGTYKKVSYMNDDTGECKFDQAGYGGAIGPFDEELSIHIRGPFSLKQFAFYTPQSTTNTKRDRQGPARRDLEERALKNVVCPKANQTTVTTGGKTFRIECGMDRQGNMGSSRQPNFSACIQKCASTSGCTQVSFVRKDKICYLKSSSPALRPQDYTRGIAGARLIVKNANKSTSPIAWTRRSYYDSRSSIASGVTFLNNKGGGSYPGIWSTKFGNSLGYASKDGLSPASSPQILSDTTLPSTSEISLFTGLPCSASNPCPYTRPSTVAYHGFGGASKIFLFEFSMPDDSTGDNMPALWFLNAQIPRTQQYGACSCWGNTDGCGELDVFEVLTPGEKRMISAVHGDQAATNPNWFARPVTKTMKGAVVLEGKQAHIRVLDDAFDFAVGLTQSQYEGLVATEPPKVLAAEVATMTLS